MGEPTKLIFYYTIAGDNCWKGYAQDFEDEPTDKEVKQTAAECLQVFLRSNQWRTYPSDTPSMTLVFCAVYEIHGQAERAHYTFHVMPHHTMEFDAICVAKPVRTLPRAIMQKAVEKEKEKKE